MSPLVLLAVLLAVFLLGAAEAAESFFTVPYDHKSPSGPSMQLRVESSSTVEAPVAFVIIADKYSDYSRLNTVFAERLNARYSARLFTISPRGWQELRSYKGGVAQLPHFTVENALLDIDLFVKKVVNPKGTSKVVVAGNGYGATLASLYRQEFPSNCVAAIADTPVLGTSVSQAQEIEHASSVLEPEVAAAFLNATEAVEDLLATGRGSELVSPFGLCSVPDASTPRLKATFWYNVVYPIVRALGVQTNRSPKTDATHDQITKTMLTRNAPLVNLGRAAGLARETSTGCIEVDYSSLAQKYHMDADNALTLVSKCIQLGTLPVPGKKQVFFPPNSGLTEEFFGGLCDSIMGPKYNLNTLKSGAAAFERRYGGPYGYKGTNVFFVASRQDPMFSQTIKSSLRTSNPLKNFSGLRGSVLIHSSPSDSAELKDIRFDLERFLDLILV